MTLQPWTAEEQGRHATDLEDAADLVKWCPTCQHTKALSDFAADRRRPDGRKWRCRKCANASDRAYDARQRQVRAMAKDEPPPTCANCHRGQHGHWCTAALWGPPCSCRCAAVLGFTLGVA